MSDGGKSFGLQPIWALRRLAAFLVDALLVFSTAQILVAFANALTGSDWQLVSVALWPVLGIVYFAWAERADLHGSWGKRLLRVALVPDDIGVSRVWVVLIRVVLRGLAVSVPIITIFLLLSYWIGSLGQTTEAEMNRQFANWLDAAIPILILFYGLLAVRAGLPGQTLYDRLCGLRPVNRGAALMGRSAD